MSSPTEVVRELYEAINQRDIPRVLSLLDEDVRADTPPGQAIVGGHFQGPQQLVQGLWGRLGESWQNLRPNVERWIEGRDGEVVTIGQYSGINRSNGRSLDAGFVHVWATRDGRIIGLQVQTDTARWNAAWDVGPGSVTGSARG